MSLMKSPLLLLGIPHSVMSLTGEAVTWLAGGLKEVFGFLPGLSFDDLTEDFSVAAEMLLFGFFEVNSEAK